MFKMMLQLQSVTDFTVTGFQNKLCMCETEFLITENEQDLRRVLSQSMTLVLQHHIRPIDVVHLVGVHRHQNTTYICLKDSEKKHKKDKSRKRWGVRKKE